MTSSQLLVGKLFAGCLGYKTADEAASLLRKRTNKKLVLS